ncbi:MAG: ATP-binding cassette domain-containing protein [Pseudomonadota bacterium]
MSGPPGIAIRGRFAFQGGQDLSVERLEIPAGQWTCLLGPSGVGKSTILRELAALETGADFDGRVETTDGAPLAGRIAFMGQSDLLAPWLDVRGNVSLGAQLRGETVDIARRDALIDRVGLKAHAGKHPPALSGGMRQRAALARTLMEDRPVALLDEPFSALDARTRAEMQELAFQTLERRTVVVVTHDPAEAARLAHRIYLVAESGLTSLPVPPAAPIRAAEDPATLSAQAELLSTLRRAA